MNNWTFGQTLVLVIVLIFWNFGLTGTIISNNTDSLLYAGLGILFVTCSYGMITIPIEENEED